MEMLKQIERESMRLDLPHFTAGDTVKVYVKIKEGEKERTQIFQGVVISKRGWRSQRHIYGSQGFIRHRR